MDIKVAAPGKLMLFGDHAVIYGYPCIVTAINKYLVVNIKKSKTNRDEFATGGISDNGFLASALNTFRKKYQMKDKVIISTESGLGKHGLGSSAAVVVATLKALTEFMNINISHRELFTISYEAILSKQKIASGFDVAASIFGGILYYQRKGEIIEQLSLDPLPLVIGFSGNKADTVSMVKELAQKRKLYKEGIDKIFQSIAVLVVQAKKALLEKDWIRLGILMNYNQDYLEDLGVSTEKLNKMILAARNAGAYGAKLSGAGGGDCMIALASPDKSQRVKEAIKNAGGEIIETNTDCAGVKILTNN